MQSSSVVFVYTSSLVILIVRRRSVPATKWRARKCPRDKMAGDKVSLRRNGWRQTVPVTKRLAMNCPRDEMQAMKRRRRNRGNERACTLVQVYCLVNSEKSRKWEDCIALKSNGVLGRASRTTGSQSARA